MKVIRFVGGLLLGATLISTSTLAAAQDFPKGPIKLIVPVPAGGGVDLLSRTLGQKMSTNLGVPVVVENKPGASAAIGTAELAKSPPDGYTIMMAYSAHATNPIFSQQLTYDADKDFTPIVFVGYIPLILVTNPRADSIRCRRSSRRRARSRARLRTHRAAPALARICQASC